MKEIGAITLVLVVIFVINFIGWAWGVEYMEKRAVKAGVAEYVATPEGEVEFKWKAQE